MLVFTTSFNDTQSVNLDGKGYQLTITEKCKENGDPPFECQSTINFPGGAFPAIVIEAELEGLASADINMDGKQELILLSAEGGNWKTVSIYSNSSQSSGSRGSWYQPIESFLWFPGSEEDKMCDAKIYWLGQKNQVRVLTTNSADENFKCDEEKKFKWKTK